MATQMHNQAIATRSTSSLFTSIYGFMRILVADSDHLYISDNIMKGLGKTHQARQNIEVNSTVMQEIFFFTFGTVVRAYGPEVILPPLFRQRYQCPTYTIPTIAPLSVPSPLEYFVSHIGTWVMGSSAWARAWAWNLAFRVCGSWVITYAKDLAVLGISGKFTTENRRQALYS